MGCKMKKKFNALSINAKKIMLAVLISMIWITTLTPVVFAATEASIKVDFDPSGVIDIAVSPKYYDFGSITAGAWKNSTGTLFTIFNNGTSPMDTEFKSNATSSGGMDLDNDGAPAADDYSLYGAASLDTPSYITNNYAQLDDAIPAGDHQHFDLCLNMGSSITVNWTAQTTTVYLQGHAV